MHRSIGSIRSARNPARWSAACLLLAGFCLILLQVASVGCARDNVGQPTARRWRPPKSLADWNLFEVESDRLIHRPVAGVVPYELNSTLFSDYTVKHRFVKLPTGQKAVYDDNRVFSFPVGTVIAKTFSYPHDQRDLSKGERLLETRILFHRDSGWEAFSYEWNDEGTSASLSLAGNVKAVSWIHHDGSTQSLDYVIPDANKCVSCHEEHKKILPIGPKARHLNRDFPYTQGAENQLVHWTKAGLLEGAPANPEEAPRNAVWDDPKSGTLDERVRAYVEINCAHCHHPDGPAKNAGLDFTIKQSDTEKLGVWKTPVAVGRGGGGRKYSIVPGNPEASILYYRLNSADPAIMMPEVARRMIHTEGVALIREWIESMPNPHVGDAALSAGGQ
jgi:uncharacterized repeat protein (TIGR03806 family)